MKGYTVSRQARRQILHRSALDDVVLKTVLYFPHKAEGRHFSRLRFYSLESPDQAFSVAIC